MGGDDDEADGERRWCVTGGADKGGVVVRTGKDVTSPQADARLATGALVRQEELVGDRLRFTKLQGEGPEDGWVTIRLKGEDNKVLMERAPVFEPLEVAAGREAGIYAAPAPAVPAGRKIRVLALHGTCGSEKVLRAQLAHLVKVGGDELEFVFCNGPQLIENPSNPLVKKQLETMQQFFPGEPLRQWCDPVGEQLGWRRYDGFEQALAAIQEALERLKPIDAVYGFSQGSNMAHAVAAQAALGRGAGLRCVVHACTAKPGWVAQLPELFEHRIPLPALLLSADQERTSNGTAEVAASYEAPEFARHSDVHRPLPGKPAEARELSETIRAFLTRHCRE